MSTHNTGFYEEKGENYLSIIIKYHQLRTISVLLIRVCLDRVSKCKISSFQLLSVAAKNGLRPAWSLTLDDCFFSCDKAGLL